jgi:hypothetical protein
VKHYRPLGLGKTKFSAQKKILVTGTNRFAPKDFFRLRIENYGRWRKSVGKLFAKHKKLLTAIIVETRET